MNKFFNKITSVLLMSSVIFSIAACANDNKEQKIKQVDTAKGRYVETDMNLSASIANGGYIFSLEKLEDNSLSMVASDENTVFKVYSSKDSGETWTKTTADTSVIPKGDGIGSAAIDKNGDIAVAYGKTMMVNGKKSRVIDGRESFLKIDKNGKSTKLDIDLPSGDKEYNKGFNSLNSLTFAPNGDLFGIGYNGIIYQVDSSTGKIKNTYTCKDSLRQYSIIGNTLIAVTGKDVERFDIATGKQTDDIKVLADYLPYSGESSKENICLLTPGKDKNELYFCNDKGLFRYVLGGNIVERMVDGSLTSFGTVDMSYMNIVANSDGSFLILYKNNDSKYSLMNYSYSKTTSTVPSNEVTVYSLNDNTTIRQEISLFQKANPDTFAMYEAGMSENNGQSPEDAIKTLNTEIMAGKGPDVMIMNDLPIDSYIDKGLLTDLSDVLGEYTKDDKLFKNIAEAYRNDDGIFVAPIRFEVPVLYSKQQVLGQLTDLKSLADFAKKFREQSPDKGLILDIMDSDSLVRQMFAVNADEWIKKDGTIDKSKLTDFFTFTKDIYQASIKGRKKSEMDAYEQKSKAYSGKKQQQNFGSFWPYDVNEGRTQLGIGSVNVINSLVYIASAMNNDKSAAYEPINQEKGYFIPTISVGVNANTKNTDAAKKFVSYLFGEEGQKVSIGGGLPINKKVFADSTKPKDVTDLNEALANQYKIEWPSGKQFSDFENMIGTLKTPVYQNTVVLDAVLEVSDKCMKGSISVAEAVDTLIQKVNIYLSE